MIDFDFKNELTTNTFTRGRNLYNYADLRNSNILLLNTKLVPIIKMQGNAMLPKLPAHSLKIALDQQFGGKTLTKDKVLEIFNSADYLMGFRISDNSYYIGKGFIGKVTSFLDFDIVPLIVYTMPEFRYNANEMSDITILVNAKKVKDEITIIKSIINQCLTEHVGDIINTEEILKYLSGKIKLPRFANIRAQKDFTETFIEQCLNSL